MLKIAMVDDEELFIEKFKTIIERKCIDFNIKCNVDCYQNGYDLIDVSFKYNLIFLDIDMPLVDGITVARHLNKIRGESEFPYIAFVTERDNLVFQALKSRPYLFIRKSDFESDIDYCLKSIAKKISKYKSRVTIHSGRTDIVLYLDNIVYIEKNKNYVIYHTVDQDYSVRSNIEYEFSRLEKNNFVRTHIGFVVNNNFISMINTDNIVLTIGKAVPLGKKYREEVKAKYFEWLGEEYV